MQNSLGDKFKVTILGSSHGEIVGGEIVGCPKGLAVNIDFINSELERRKPKLYGTTRKEEDNLVFTSGIDNGQTNGDKLVFFVKNNNVRKQDYNYFHNWFRPSHIDYTYFKKFGEDSLTYKDNASARMFLPIVVAGCFAKQILLKENISIKAEVMEVGGINYLTNQLQAKNLLNIVCAKGDTVSGKIRCRVSGLKAGIGEPIFKKLSAMLAKNMITIPSCYGFCLGNEDRASLLGSQDIDRWNTDFSTVTNNSGGLNGGITNGGDIVFFVSFHPIHTLRQIVEMINPEGELKQMRVPGRHDACQLFRTEVIVEAMTALTIVEYILN